MANTRNGSFFVPKIRRRDKLAQSLSRTQGGLGKFGRPGCFQHYDGRSQTGLPHSTTTYTPSASTHSAQLFTSSGYQGVHSYPSLEEVHPQNLHSTASLLLTPFYCAQEGWSKSPYHRSFPFEHVAYHPYIQDGAGIRNCFLHCRPDVGLHCGSSGCILPRPGGVVLSHVPCICGRPPNLCFSGSPLWPVYSPVGFFQGDEAYQGSPPSSTFPISHISGRLSYSCSFQGGPCGTDYLHTVSSPESWSPHPPQEVESDTLSDSRVPRGYISSRPSSSFSTQYQSLGDNVCVSGHSSPVSTLSSSTGERGRLAEFCILLRPSGTASTKADSELDELTHFSGVERYSCSLGQHGGRPSSEMDGRVILKVSSPYVSTGSRPASDDRCITDRVGRSSDPVLNFRDLAGLLPILFDKLAGTQGGVSLSSAFSPASQRSMCPAPLRQYNRSGLYSPPGDAQISAPYGSDSLHSRVLLSTFDKSCSQALERLPERPGRPGLPHGTDFHRMVSGRGYLLLDKLSVRTAPSRPFCHSREPPSPDICLPVPGSKCSGGKRPIDSLGPLELDIPVSTCSSASQSVRTSPTVSGAGGVDCSIICSVKLAPQPSSQVSGPHPSPSGTFSVAEDQRRSGIPSKSFCVSASRVATIRTGLLAAGFNSAAADVYLLSHRESSTRQYQSVWRKFLAFLNKEGISFQAASVGVVCNYLTYEATVNKMQYRTVTGYRSALRLPIFWCCGLEINTLVSNQFLRGLYNLNPPLRAAPMPDWNINVLLSYLQSDRFEPLHSAPFDLLTQKTLCLLLLASGRRVSEIANLSRGHHEDSSRPSLLLEWVPDFKPKHDDPGFRPPLPSISFLASDKSADLTLCPVRAYNTFHSVSQSWIARLDPQDRHNFLWAQPDSSLPLSIKQLSAMFVKVVKDALKDAGHPVGLRIGPHQMRKLGASLSHNAGHDEGLVMRVMGFSSVQILRKNYVSKVPSLNVSCVLPGGPYFPPGVSTLSDTDSD